MLSYFAWQFLKRVNSHKEPTRKDYELLDLTLS